MKLLLFVYFIVAWSAADAGKMKTYRFGSLTDPLDDKMKDWMRDSPLLIPEPTPQDCRVTADCTCEMNQHTPCKPTINIILLSDCSFCFRDVWTDEITAMKRISKAITKSFSAESNFALMQFGNTGYYPATQPYEFSQPFQLGPIDTAIDGLTFCGGTAYLDQALSRASSYFQSLSPVEAKNPSFLVVLTNGNSVDTVSMKSIQHSVDLLNTSNVTILPVAVDAGGRNDTVFNMLNPKYPNYQFLLSNKASYVTTLIDIMIWYCPCQNAAAAENCICKTEQICEIPSPNVEQYRGPKGPKGVPGMDGIDGPPGPPGPKGLSGQPGNPGTKGEDAPDGFPGPTGPLGQQGSEGDKGSKGPYGENGKPGPPGSKGEEGVVGTKGDKGDKGRKGNIGVEGSKGLKGQPGPQGEPGPSTTGPPGPNGPPGKKGGPGQPGLIGNDGNKGKPGCSGCQGEPGDVGRKGERGPPGVNGKDGSDGPAGPQGPLGRIGRPGAQGPLGNPGVPGPSGVPGNNGRPGSPGSQGVQGLMGLPGPVSNDPGPTGQIGYQGNQGLNGWPGPNGSPGPQGPRGVQGPEGLEGIPGKDRHDQASIEILVWKELRKQYKGCGKPCCTRCDQIEGQVEPNPCNSVAVDLVFFVDGSGSISEFSSIQKWMGNILKTFNGSNEDHLMRVTIVQFSSHVKQELQSYMCNKAATESGTACQSVAAINSAIKNIKQEKSSTRTWTGVNYLADNFTPFDVNAETIMVTITDGTPTDSDQYNQNALDRVHHMFHKMIAVSVGDDLDTDVLKKLTKHSTIIPVDNLSALDDSIKLLVGELCKEPTTEWVDYMPVDDYDDSEEEGV